MPNAKPFGINASLCPDEIEYDEAYGKIQIGNNTKKELEKNIKNAINNCHKKYDSILQNIILEYNEIYEDKIALK